MSFTLSASAKKTVASLLDQYLLETNLPPKVGSKPLFIDGLACGWVHPDAVLALEGMQGIALNTDSIHVLKATYSAHLPPSTSPQHSNSASQTPDLHAFEPLNTLLAKIALRLKEAGCCVAWRNELLDVWAGETSIAAIERGVVRPLGITTRAVHLHARNAAGALWVARRALNKATDPGLWDTLVGGLVGYGEPDDLALVRETDEEAGLSPEDIEHRTPIRQITIMKRQLPEGYQIERVLTSECVLADHCIPANKDGEVMHIQCIEPAEVVEMLLAKAFTTEATIVIAEDLVRRG
jgi:ADP-ribose pyrophosphatase YjhB (NUDIX family)